MAEPVALASLALDVALGWPRGLYTRIGHPVGAFARIIGWWEGRWNRPALSASGRRLHGLLLMLLLIAGTAAAGLALEALARLWLGRWWWLGIAVLAWPALAQRSLWQHVRPVADALEADNLPVARAQVGMVVGRDVEALDEAGVARAGIETLSESFCDGVVAPAFWLLLLGLPGVWAYKAINTADSLIGHREDRWRAFGWAAARIDDAANLLPARLSGLLICLAGGRGWRTLWRDHGQHASPNAGWPEAAMAGALGVALAGPISYDGQVQQKPWIGAEGRVAGAADLRRALGIYLRACLWLWALMGVAAWRP
ncbi:adenosylcobinamide-phosphate synthase CbiB [Sandaracinobacter sp. RS1-74]|uniref:adenosylcobinamide-phosphate synthase CbiB n=1 Tax=Sandaracinobacteroides sayramensis TaxID=2913411 RepID=UPI001EDBB5A6|nr:adenosylcobinamide-phosphate synthase CbiB [Sandaracinobacteroides sayramensis]MCG2841618.1 adenosylcobinamide-phosphate synthase CbiB [Sandaracinobacteroides sayramensis]